MAYTEFMNNNWDAATDMIVSQSKHGGYRYYCFRCALIFVYMLMGNRCRWHDHTKGTSLQSPQAHT